MKIQLERKLRSCPDRLRCVSCNQVFSAHSIRTLLCRDNGLIEGDLCPKCVQQGSARIKSNLRNRALITTHQEQSSPNVPSPQQRSLELLEIAGESLTMPPMYYWWWKKLEIFSTESRELELARHGCPKLQTRQLEITFLSHDPPVEQDI
jgi:hypothetical protein